MAWLASTCAGRTQKTQFSPLININIFIFVCSLSVVFSFLSALGVCPLFQTSLPVCLPPSCQFLLLGDSQWLNMLFDLSLEGEQLIALESMRVEGVGLSIINFFLQGKVDYLLRVLHEFYWENLACGWERWSEGRTSSLSESWCDLRR